MGIQVTIPGCEPGNVRVVAKDLGMALRLVENMPAFPDEEIPEEFSEIRLGSDGGMISVRNQPGALVLVVWGNAEESLCQALVKMAGGLAARGAGIVRAAGKEWALADWLGAGTPLVAG